MCLRVLATVRDLLTKVKLFSMAVIVYAPTSENNKEETIKCHIS